MGNPSQPVDTIYELLQPIQQPTEPPQIITLSRQELAPPPAAILPFCPLPFYIKPLPSRFGFDDITYLQNKGVLTIPEDDLRNELLQSYADYMHPFMPLLDWRKFIGIMQYNGQPGFVSLLLFQAVMFTGLATIDMHFLRTAGFTTRIEARWVFFNKARLLYDLDYEDDSMILIQALLLMTYWKESPTGRKETHHWIEIAVSLSHKVGLHWDPAEYVPVGSWPQKLRKQIWWSVYMRDSQIALGTRKSTLMKDVDFSVPMLQQSDFELTTSSDELYFLPTNYQMVPNTEQQRQLAILCIEMAKLCMCIRLILSVQHGITGSKGSTRTATMIFSDSLEPGQESTQDSAAALQLWKNKIPEVAQYTTPTQEDLLSGRGCLVLNRSFLHMLYYASLSSLHRSRLHPSPVPLTREARSQVISFSHNRVRHAAHKITTIASALHDMDLVRYLPSPTITILLPAIVTHLLDVLAPERFLQLKSLQDFSKCMQIMAALRDMYAAADYSTGFLQAAIERTEIGPVTPPNRENSELSNVNADSQHSTGNDTTARSTFLGLESQNLNLMSNFPQTSIFDTLDTGSDASSTKNACSPWQNHDEQLV